MNYLEQVFITELPKLSKIRRGRPPTHSTSTSPLQDDIDSTQRQRSRFVVEDTKGIYSIYDDDYYSGGKKNKNRKSIPLPQLVKTS